MPFAIFGLFALLSTLHYLLVSESKFWTLWFYYMRIFTLGILMFHTALCVATFEFFKCDGPYELAPGRSRKVLALDYDVSCDTRKYRSYSIYVSLMLFVYVVGAPSAIMLKLWANRRTSRGLTTPNELALRDGVLGSLTSKYRAQFWWAEFGEIYVKPVFPTKRGSAKTLRADVGPRHALRTHRICVPQQARDAAGHVPRGPLVLALVSRHEAHFRLSPRRRRFQSTYKPVVNRGHHAVATACTAFLCTLVIVAGTMSNNTGRPNDAQQLTESTRSISFGGKMMQKRCYELL